MHSTPDTALSLIGAWERGQRYSTGSGSASTDGTTIKSYSTALVVLTGRDVPGNETEVVINTTRYSLTTTVYQRNLLDHLRGRGYKIIEVADADRGISTDTLLRLGLAQSQNTKGA